MKKKTRRREFEKKMAEYRRFLKDDFDWDYAYILRLLQFKLARTRRCILANKIVVSAKKIGAQIREVEILLGRVQQDRYFEEISKGFQKKYGRSRIVELPREKGMRGIPITIRSAWNSLSCRNPPSVMVNQTTRTPHETRKDASRRHGFIRRLDRLDT